MFNDDDEFDFSPFGATVEVAQAFARLAQSESPAAAVLYIRTLSPELREKLIEAAQTMFAASSKAMMALAMADGAERLLAARLADVENTERNDALTNLLGDNIVDEPN